MENPRWEDFRYVRMPETQDNMFSWFGNGLVVAQERGEKTTQYLDDCDAPAIIKAGPRPSISSNIPDLRASSDGIPYGVSASVMESVATMPS